MFYRLFFLMCRFPLIASSAIPALVEGGQTVLYPVEASTRGTEIFNSFKTLSPTANRGTVLPEILLQTKIVNNPQYMTYRYLVNGVIPYVQNITQTTYNTLLIVSYLTSALGNVTQYLVVPVEQIIMLPYFPNSYYVPPTPFSAANLNGAISYFSIHSTERALDIVSAVSQLLTTFKQSGNTQVWIQTTLNGPFNYPVPNGLIQNVKSVSVNNSLLQITFSPPNFTPNQVIVVAPEQVQQITYIASYLYP